MITSGRFRRARAAAGATMSKDSFNRDMDRFETEAPVKIPNLRGNPRQQMRLDSAWNVYSVFLLTSLNKRDYEFSLDPRGREAVRQAPA